MGIGISLLGDFEDSALLFIAGANVLVFVHLLAKATDSYISNLAPALIAKTADSQAYADARLRLDSFWTLALVIATAATVKLVLTDDLADQIIAAWFVGQGFALQHHVQSYISGIKVRNNNKIWTAMFTGAEITIPNDENVYTLFGQDVFTITICTKKSSAGITILRVLPWSKIEELLITDRP